MTFRICDEETAHLWAKLLQIALTHPEPTNPAARLFEQNVILINADDLGSTEDALTPILRKVSEKRDLLSYFSQPSPLRWR